MVCKTWDTLLGGIRQIKLQDDFSLVMKIIVWNSQDKCLTDYPCHCGQWISVSLIDIFYCLEKVAFVCRDGLYSGESVLYSIHSNIGSLIGIRLQDDFWLFAHHESNLVNAYHIGEFYLREISDRFRKAAFIADFKKKSYSWVQETVGKLYCIALPEGYYPHTVNYLFTIHVACTDLYLLEGYSETSNQPTFFELDI